MESCFFKGIERKGPPESKLHKPHGSSFFSQLIHAKQLVVIDRAISVGACGPVASEVKAALYGEAQRPSVYNFVAGISGRDVTPLDFIKMVDKAEIEIEEGNKEGYEIYGVRE
jgi:pyruvate ferredoxin oxidoreductase alpha subunit